MNTREGTSACTSTVCSPDERALRFQTYYALGGVAEGGVHAPLGLACLQRLVNSRSRSEEALAVIGAGSNMICSDRAFPGAYVSCRSMVLTQWLSRSATRAELFCEAGLSNTELSECGLDAGFSDAAWMYRMPGQLGATVRMNARCYGGEISRIVSSIFTLGLDGVIRAWAAEDIFKGYKNTLLMEISEIVVGIVVRFSQPEDRSEILMQMETCERDRHRKKHFLFPSCGSTFKNNYSVGKPSGQVFDELGYRGASRGKAQVSAHHANFIFNTGGARADDVLDLAAEMRVSALDHGMELMLEVQPVGIFPENLSSALALDQLDPRTEKVSQGQVLTGVLKGSQACKFEKKAASPEQPFIHVEFPLLAWEGDESDWLGRVMFRVKQLRSWSQAERHSAGEPLLQLEFCVEPWDDLGRLFSASPSSGQTGFQDGLWKSSVFECFLFAGDHPDCPYLEIEAHSSESWLALCFDTCRVRAAHSVRPVASDFDGLKIVSKVGSGPGTMQSLSFLCSEDLLRPFMIGNEIRVKGAYTRTESHFAVAPHPGSQAAAEKPDFHSAVNSFIISLV